MHFHIFSHRPNTIEDNMYKFGYNITYIVGAYTHPKCRIDKLQILIVIMYNVFASNYVMLMTPNVR